VYTRNNNAEYSTRGLEHRQPRRVYVYGLAYEPMYAMYYDTLNTQLLLFNISSLRTRSSWGLVYSFSKTRENEKYERINRKTIISMIRCVVWTVLISGT